MNTTPKELLTVDLQLSDDPVIGAWLWAAQDARDRLRRELAAVTPEMVDWRAPSSENTIGMLLYHIALIEADWLFIEALGQDEYPAEIAALFPDDVRDEQGILSAIAGESIEQHLQRLDAVRASLLAAYRTMSLEEFRRVRSFPQYDVTPEWVLHHLIQHESEHRGQIGALRVEAAHHLA